MAQLKKIGMAAGTFSVALGIGFVMQNGDAVASRFGTDTEVSSFAAEPSDAIITAQSAVVTLPALDAPDQANVDPADALLVSRPDGDQKPDAPLQLANIDVDDIPDFGGEQTDQTPLNVSDCVPEIATENGSAATVDVVLTAPCYTNTSFTVHHQGMMFSEITNAVGYSEFTVPALASTAVIIVAFDNGDGAVATSVVPDFSNYDRAVLQWQGQADVMLSAYENGAAFGDTSHIHSKNPGNMLRLETAEGGYLMSLGQSTGFDPLMAEVYTFPTGTILNPADVVLAAEAEITTGNCGQELNAQSIQIKPNGVASALDLTMIMPACDAVGDFLILQNMFEDLTLAAR